MLWTTVIVALSVAGGQAQKCNPLSFGEDSFVCVCNATHCDSTPDMGTPAKNTFHWYMSNKLNERMQFTNGQMHNIKVNGSVIALNRTKRYQTILGFGAAFTDAAGINIKNISIPTQENLIQSYFGEKGSRYNIGRVPIGGTDFSERGYSLDDFKMDKSLEHFALAEEDLVYKIPLLQRAAIVNPKLKLMGVPWSSPKWMKYKESFGSFSVLNPDYYQLFTDYLLKFFDGYKKFGLGFWSLSIGNEPQNALSANTHKTTMAWTPYGAAQFIGKNLGPSLNASEYKNIQILILDDTLDFVSWYVPIVMNHKDAKKFISGSAIHYHQQTVGTESSLDKIHTSYPDKYILMTEASQSFSDKICLGCWSITDAYILEMFTSMKHWIAGWVDLNLALNQTGGPNLSNNKYDAAIIVDAENDRFFKQPLFYVMQHFSRFVPPGSVRIDTRLNFEPFFTELHILAFETPQNETVVIIYNRVGVDVRVSIVDGYEEYINLDLPEYSLNTIIYKREI